ncbi:hypothetical protein LCGC14_0462140 [marine sediment metagenome]|uniref:Uncharacterized protein n=1 Tax=marine sediment metagenome TaxID=412755 RepID=A0A0F9SER6_9ZZZZ
MKDKQRRPNKKNSMRENRKHPYKKVRKVKQNHGINCSCKECKKVRTFLKRKEKKGEIYLSGLPEDLKKIRR